MKQSDYFEIMDMMKKFISTEMPEGLNSYDNEKLVGLFTKVVNEKSGFCLVDEEDNVIGCLACTINEVLFNRRKIAIELIFWLEPEYRNLKNSSLLLQYYEDWSKEKKCDLISLIHMENDSKDKAKHLYSKFNYRQVEYLYIKETN